MSLLQTIYRLILDLPFFTAKASAAHSSKSTSIAETYNDGSLLCAKWFPLPLFQGGLRPNTCAHVSSFLKKGYKCETKDLIIQSMSHWLFCFASDIAFYSFVVNLYSFIHCILHHILYSFRLFCSFMFFLFSSLFSIQF